MSEPIAIRLAGVGKMYKMFSSRGDNFLDALGMGRLLPWHHVAFREFWALRGIDLELRVGARIGIIGRNGAGKSTLLKLMTGNLAPSEGTVEVEGQVQALLEAGAGFHPDFTGYENIRASLTYQGLTSDEIDEAVDEIAEFTELGDFLEQPFKTYSTGMQARLAFAAATAVRPEILIIDEILGAGDAYFIGKSTERMRQLVDSGASILLVSHSMTQITQMCETAIWLDRGQVVEQGESLQVVKSYEQYVRRLEDQRLQAKNAKRRTGVSSPFELERPDASLVVRFVLEGDGRGTLDVGEVRLRHGGEISDRVEVGAPQDANPLHSGFVLLEGSAWSAPLDEAGGFFRRLEAGSPAPAGALAFVVLALREGTEWEIEFDYRLDGDTPAAAELWMDGERSSVVTMERAAAWRTGSLALPVRAARTPTTRMPVRAGSVPGGVTDGRDAGVSRWPGEGSLQIGDLRLLDRFDSPCAVFEVDSYFKLELTFEAVASGTYSVLPVAVVYRTDGLNVSSLIGDWLTRDFEQGATHRASLTLYPLNLGNGSYVLSVALYKSFDPHLNEPPVVYDWIDRSVEFQVVGTPPGIASVFLHPAEWAVE